MKDYLTTAAAADVTRLSPSTLRALRVKGGGPPYILERTNGRRRVLYHPQQLMYWLMLRASRGGTLQ